MKRILFLISAILLGMTATAQNDAATVSLSIRRTAPQTEKTLPRRPAKHQPIFLGQPSSFKGERGSLHIKQRAETRDENGIITAPADGTEKLYARAGKCYYASGADVVTSTQQGALKLVECADGTVYMQQPVSSYSAVYAATSWIKGRRDGQYLVFPHSQVISVSNFYYDNIILCMGKYDEDWGTFTPDLTKDIVFKESADGTTLSLMNSNNVSPLCVFYDDEEQNWLGYGDWATVLTLDASAGSVTPPDDAEISHFVLSAEDFSEGPVSYNAVMATAGSDVYMKDFCFWADDIWIKGQKQADGSIQFPKEQYIRDYTDEELYFYGLKNNHGGYTPSFFTLAYDELTGGYTTDDDILINYGKITTSMRRAEQLSKIVLRPDGSEGSVPVIIHEQPEGILRTYTRSGGAFGYEMGQVVETVQDGTTIDIVTDPSGKFVYMRNPISQATPSKDAWVKGIIMADGKIRVPLMQWVDWSDDFGYGHRTAALIIIEEERGGVVGVTYKTILNLSDLTFSVDESTGTISLDPIEGVAPDGEYPTVIYGLVFSDNLDWSGYGDYHSVYTLFHDDVLTIPASAKQEDWGLMYHNDMYSQYLDVKVARMGETVYLAGLNLDNPQAAIAGTVAGGHFVFPTGQYLGQTATGDLAYFSAATFEQVEEYREEWGMSVLVFKHTAASTLILRADPKDPELLRADEGTALLVTPGQPTAYALQQPLLALYDPSLNIALERDATPALPSIVYYEDGYDMYGLQGIFFDIPARDADGHFLLPAQLSYRFWVKEDDESVHPYTFSPDNYVNLAANLTEVPYLLELLDNDGYEDIALHGECIYLYEAPYADFGIQSIYSGKGVRRATPVVWYSGEVGYPEGIERQQTPFAYGTKGDNRQQTAYDLTGRKVIKSGLHGLFLQKGRKLIR
ncbi:MAG: hypothetical protein MJZ54_01070 [Bacteroidaceae bacterium]|nr:hypothetical protein [Bacteroidaceae bacterium]